MRNGAPKNPKWVVEKMRKLEVGDYIIYKCPGNKHGEFKEYDFITNSIGETAHKSTRRTPAKPQGETICVGISRAGENAKNIKRRDTKQNEIVKDRDTYSAQADCIVNKKDGEAYTTVKRIKPSDETQGVIYKGDNNGKS